MLPRLALLLTSAVLAAGCSVVTEVGKPCVMVRRATPTEEAATGKKAIPLTFAEVRTNQDFISFSAIECEELLCVRDPGLPDGPDNAEALGYCSDECVPGSDTCEVTDDNVSRELANRMECRNLVLDPDALAAFCVNDPALCQRIFGPNRSATFCAGRPPPR